MTVGPFGSYLLLLLLLSHFSCVRLCATPVAQTAAHQAPPVPGILQARTLEWVAIAFSVGSYLASFKTKNPEQCLAHASY